MLTRNTRIDDQINVEIMENELSATDWGLNDLVWDLRWWFDFFNIAFFKEEPVPLPVLSFQKARITSLGSYRIGRNSIGVKENINLNSVHLERALWETLSTLLHELCHSWQEKYGEPSHSWFHNKEFRKKLASLGIITDQKGEHQAVTDPFVHLLRQHGIKFEIDPNKYAVIEIPKRPKPKGKSKLKKWVCSCGQTVRVGKKEFFARCTLCNAEFELEE